MSDDEIATTSEKMKAQLEEQAEMMAAMQPDPMMGGGMPPPMEEGVPTGGEEISPDEEPV